MLVAGKPKVDKNIGIFSPLSTDSRVFAKHGNNKNQMTRSGVLRAQEKTKSRVR
jgi:hypothetical protein